MAALGAVLVIVLACNPDLFPVLALVDAVGLDVLLLLLGIQVVTLLPWLRDYGARSARIAQRLLPGVLAGATGEYLRQLGWWWRGTR